MMSVGYHFNSYFDHNSEHNKVIHKVLWIGHENSQNCQNKESNNKMWGKFQHNEKTGSETAFCSKTCWKRSLALNCIVIEPKYPNGLLLLSLTMKCILSSLPNSSVCLSFTKNLVFTLLFSCSFWLTSWITFDWVWNVKPRSKWAPKLSAQ